MRAHKWAHQHGKPLLVLETSQPEPAARAASWLQKQKKRFGADMTLSIGGPRESEAPGIYARARALIERIIDRAADNPRRPSTAGEPTQRSA